MSYLLIFFIIVAVLSPLAWLKTSPAQARKAAFRKRAAELGLKPQLVPEPTAEEGDKRPGAVRYFLVFPASIDSLPGSWTLMRNSSRGWPSDWPDWNWFRGQAEERWYPAIEGLLQNLPATVYGVRCDQQGISAYMDERGDIGVVEQVSHALKCFVDEVLSIRH